jgi:hypothetical protein
MAFAFSIPRKSGASEPPLSCFSVVALLGNAFVDILALISRKELIADVAEHCRHIDAEVCGDEIVRLWPHAPKEIVQLPQGEKAL